MSNQYESVGLFKRIKEKTKSVFWSIIRKEEHEENFDSRLMKIYGKLLLDKLQIQGESINKACSLALTTSSKQDLKKAIEVILDMKSLNNLTPDMPDVKKPFSLAWHVDSKWVALKMGLFYFLLTLLITKLLGLHGSIALIFILIFLYLIGMHFRGRRYFNKITALLRRNKEWRKEGYRINVKKRYLFIVENRSVKDEVEKYFDMICDHTSHSYIEEALLYYKEEKPHHYSILEDRFSVERRTDTVKTLSIHHSKTMEDALADKIREFIYRYFKIEGATISGPNLLEVDEDGRQAWWMKVKGVTAEQFERKKQSIENYTGKYFHGAESGVHQPGDIVVILAPFRKAAEESIIQSVLATIDDKKVTESESTVPQRKSITYVNPYVKDWESIYSQHFQRYNFEPPEFIADPTGSTELHIVRTKGLTIDALKSKEKVIESHLKKQVYDMHENYQEIGAIAVEMANKSLPKLITYNEVPKLMQEDKFILGVDIKGPVIWKLDDQGHCGVAGLTGGGKSTAMRYFVHHIREKNGLIIIADFKEVEFHYLRNKGYKIIDHPEEFISLSQTIRDEVKKRIHHFKEQGVTQYYEYFRLSNSDNKLKKFPRIFFIIEEVSAVRLNLTAEEYGKAISNLTDLVQRARSFGVHLILTTQRPTAYSFGNADIRDNLGVIIGCKMKRAASKMIFDDSRAADKITSNEKGVFITKNASSESQMKIPFMEGGEFQKYVETWDRNPYENYKLGFEDDENEMNIDKVEEKDNVTNKKSTQNPFWM